MIIVHDMQWLAASAGCALAMTVAMVRFTTALIDSEPSSTVDLIGGMAAGFVMSGTVGRAVTAVYRSHGVFPVWRGSRRRRR